MIKRTCRSSASLLAAGLLGSSVVWSSAGAVDVLERSYDAFRTGANTAETALTPATVNSSANQFHRRFVMTVDGKIEGSPLYASGVSIAGEAHNVVYVATMHNSVYAFDADTGAQLSARWLGSPVTGHDLHVVKPHTIHTEWGVASTPVIDRSTGTLYVVRWGYESGVTGPRFRLFGLDMSNLDTDKFSSVLIDGYNVGGTGFDRYRQMQRAALACQTRRREGGGDRVRRRGGAREPGGFPEFAKMSPAEKIRYAYLKEHGLSEDDLKAMSATDRDAIGAEIRQQIRQSVERDTEKRTGRITDVRV